MFRHIFLLHIFLVTSLGPILVSGACMALYDMGWSPVGIRTEKVCAVDVQKKPWKLQIRLLFREGAYITKSVSKNN
jgi:hypothetical protein